MIEHLHGDALAAPELLDDGDALLELAAAILGALDFGQHLVQAGYFRLRGGDFSVERRGPGRERPVPAADTERGGAEDHHAGERRPLTGIEERERGGLARNLPLDAEKIDANHRSLTRRSARPTATAAVDDCSAGSPNFFASHVTVRNGSKPSTGALKRS